MANELAVVNSNISVELQGELEGVLDHLIENAGNNRNEINRLVFESTALLTNADMAQSELQSKGFFKRLIGGISGDNQRLQNEINTNRAAAMYASQRLLTKLGEQNQLSFDLISALNNKLNNSLSRVTGEIENIYDGLRKFLNANRSELVQLESRLSNVERNVEILNWQNSIEYLAFNGIEYRELDDAAKLLCLAKDFYEKTHGNWNTQDLLLLKTAMASVDMDSNKNVNYFNILKEIATTPALKEKLLENNDGGKVDDPSYLITMSTISKINSLQNEESYLVETIADYMSNSGVSFDANEAVSDLTKKYLAENAFVNVDTDIKAYDFLIDLLFNLKAVESGEYAQLTYSKDGNIADKDEVEIELPEELLKACELFKNCEFEEALPIFRKLAGNNVTEAMYFLGVYLDIDNDLVSRSEGEFWFKYGASKGDLLCESLLLLDNYVSYNELIEEEYSDLLWNQYYNFSDKIINILSSTSSLSYFYEYVYAKISHNIDYLKALSEQGNWQASIHLAELYRHGAINKKVDLDNAIKYYQDAIDCGYIYALYDVAKIYDDIENLDKAIEYYQKYYKLDLPLTSTAANRIGILYSTKEDNYNAVKWFEKACELGAKYAYSNLAFKLEDKEPYKAIDLYSQAFRLFEKTDSDKAGEIAHDIARIYLDFEDFDNTFKWDKIAAELGNPMGMYGLGMLYKFRPNHINYVLSIYWLQKALENDVDYAEEALDDFTIQLNE